MQAAKVRELGLEEFVAWMRARIAAECDEAATEAAIQAAPPEHLWHGLKRYLDLSSAA
jgi:hypothetical protein